jgi:hypothetical protein
MKLAVTKFKDGSIIRQKANSERAGVLLTSVALVNNNGSFWEQKRVAVLRLPAGMAKELNPTEGADLNTALIAMGVGAHKIILVESFKPFYEGQSPKRKGKDGEIITVNGAPVYQEYQCVPVGHSGDSRVTAIEEVPQAPVLTA